MGRAGRKRKQGKRQPNGQLRRTITPDKGCEGVIRRQRMYARRAANDDQKTEGRQKGADTSNTYDAIGRAFNAGLLGWGERAAVLRDTARTIAAQYWRVYGFASPDSLARFQPSAGMGISDPVRDRIREDALNDSLETIGKVGRDVRRAFDQLVIDMNPDHGPPFLDRIIQAQRNNETPAERDTALLRLAVQGLQEIA